MSKNFPPDKIVIPDNRRGRRIVQMMERRPNAKFLICTNRKGGVGKTLASLAAIELLELHGRRVIVVQLDQQERLSRSLNRSIISLPTDFLKASRTDPSAGLRAFRPLMEVLDRPLADDEVVLLDVGANMVGPFCAFAALSGLDEDLVAAGITTTVLVPTLAEPESLSLASRTIREICTVLPSAAPVLIENQRDGRLAELLPGSRAYEAYHGQLLPTVGEAPHVIMPAVTGRVWPQFERHHCRPMAVVAMDVPTVMALTGLPRSEAKVARGDVAAWVADMDTALRPVLGIAADVESDA